MTAWCHYKVTESQVFVGVYYDADKMTLNSLNCELATIDSFRLPADKELYNYRLLCGSIASKSTALTWITATVARKKARQVL